MSCDRRASVLSRIQCPHLGVDHASFHSNSVVFPSSAQRKRVLVVSRLTPLQFGSSCKNNVSSVRTLDDSSIVESLEAGPSIGGSGVATCRPPNLLLGDVFHVIFWQPYDESNCRSVFGMSFSEAYATQPMACRILSPEFVKVNRSSWTTPPHQETHRAPPYGGYVAHTSSVDH